MEVDGLRVNLNVRPEMKVSFLILDLFQGPKMAAGAREPSLTKTNTRFLLRLLKVTLTLILMSE